MMVLNKIRKDLLSLENTEKSLVYKNFHKTGKDGYASGERFLGLTVSEIRDLAHKYIGIDFEEIKILLHSDIHEEKYLACEILSAKYRKFPEKKEDIVKFYIKNSKLISGWDLVDTTAHQILGDFLRNKNKNILCKFAKSDNSWERRISIISTYSFIKENRFEDTYRIAEILIKDKEDLIHKAVGWMLREVGKKDRAVLEAFLKKHYRNMPRTTLRYAIERFSEEERRAYLEGTA